MIVTPTMNFVPKHAFKTIGYLMLETSVDTVLIFCFQVQINVKVVLDSGYMKKIIAY